MQIQSSGSTSCDQILKCVELASDELLNTGLRENDIILFGVSITNICEDIYTSKIFWLTTQNK